MPLQLKRMFERRLYACTRGSGPAARPRTTRLCSTVGETSCAKPDEARVWFPGNAVMLSGLSKAELNGLVGKVGDATASGRWNVHLKDGRVVAVKPVNMRLPGIGHR